MASYLLGKRPKMNQMLMSRDTVKKLGSGGKEYRVADAFLNEHKELKGTLTYSQRKELGKRIFQSGGGNVSKSKDRFGFTEGDFVKTLEDMRISGALTRQETIRAAEKTLKSSGAYKRHSMNELRSFDPSKASSQSPEAHSLKPDRPALLPEKKTLPQSFVRGRTVAESFSGKSIVSRSTSMPSQARSSQLRPSAPGTKSTGSLSLPSRFIKPGGSSFPKLSK